MATSPPTSMDTLLQGMPEETVLLALKMAQIMEGKSKQDLEAMLEKFDQPKPSRINDDPGIDSVNEDESSPKMDNNLERKELTEEVDSADLTSEEKEALVNGTPNRKLENNDTSRLDSQKDETSKGRILPEKEIESGEEHASQVAENREDGRGEDTQNFTSNHENSSYIADDIKGEMQLQNDVQNYDNDVNVVSSDDDVRPSTPASGVGSSMSELSASSSERLNITQNVQGTLGPDRLTKNISEPSSLITENHKPKQDKLKDFSDFSKKNIQEASQAMNKNDNSPQVTPTHSMPNEGQIKGATHDFGNHKSFSDASRVITLDPESYRVNFKSYSTSPIENKPNDLPHASTTPKHQASNAHSKPSKRIALREQYEEFPSLPVEIKNPAPEPTQSDQTYTSMNDHPKQRETDQDDSIFITSPASMISTSGTAQEMSNAILSANTALPSIPLYYQPHIVMKDNLPVLMLKPVWAPNLSSELSQSINLNGSTMLFPLSRTDDLHVSEQVNITSFDSSEKTGEKGSGEQSVEHSRESDFEKKSPTEKHHQQDWPTWTSASVNEEKTPVTTNPFLDESGDSSSASSSSPSTRVPRSNFGFPLPSSEYLTGPSSNPFNPEESASDSSKEGSLRTDFKTIPKSMLSSQMHARGGPVNQNSTTPKASRGPLVSQKRDDVMSPRGHQVGHTIGSTIQSSGLPVVQQRTMQPHMNPDFDPKGHPVSYQEVANNQTPRELPLSQPSGIISQPHASQQSKNRMQPWHTPVSQANGDSQQRQHLSTDSMVTLLEVSNDPTDQATGYTSQIPPDTQPSLPSARSNFTTAHVKSSASSSLPPASPNFTTAHVTSSTGHGINGVTADPCVSAVVNVGNANSQPETKHKMPGHVAPYWVPDDQVFKCAYCHLKFTFIRRKHHCRGCGKIFCNDCCSQLARLNYLQYQIGRICIICTNVIKDFKKKKKTTKPGSPKSNSPIKQPKTATNRPQPQSVVASRTGQTSVLNSPRNSEMSSPQNQPELVTAPPEYEPSHRGYPPSIMSGGEPPTLTGGVMNSPPQSTASFQPLRMSHNHAVAMATPSQQANTTATSNPISQSERSAFHRVQEDASTPHKNPHESSRTMNQADKQDRGVDYSEYKLPTRPAGRIVSWNGQSFASRLLAQDRRKSLARDLKELPHGVTMQLSDELKVIVRKIKVQSSPLVQAWSCHSSGLKEFNQQEIAMHFKIKAKEDVVPEEILRMYKVILDLVKLGNTFHHSNFLAFKSPFLGTSDNAALIFASSSLVRQPKAFGESKPNRLYSILVKRSELEYAQYTPTRFLLRLGQEFKSFPYPLLNSRDRAPVYDGVDPGDTIYNTCVALNNHLKNSLPEAIIPGLTVLQEDSKVVLQITVESQALVLNFFDRLIVKTNQTATIPLVSDLTTNVDQYRVYHQSIHTDEISLRKHMSLFRNPMNPTHHGVRSVTGLGFLLLLLGDNESPVLEQRGKLVDDGAIVRLTDIHTQRLRQCLHDRSNCHFYLGDQFEMLYFELRWLEEPCLQETTKESWDKSTTQESQKEYPGTATIDVRHSGQPSELKKMADARLGDVLILARLLEQRIKQASTEALMMQANRMKAGETKELVLKLSIRNGLTKWSIGPANQPMGLIRSLQMALYDVRLSDLKNSCLDLSFDVTIIKQFDLIADQQEKDL